MFSMKMKLPPEEDEESKQKHQLYIVEEKEHRTNNSK